jgi:hypothetical protein
MVWEGGGALVLYLHPYLYLGYLDCPPEPHAVTK